MLDNLEIFENLEILQNLEVFNIFEISKYLDFFSNFGFFFFEILKISKNLEILDI